MAFGFVAFHYPAPEHLDAFVREAHQVAEAARRQPGFLSVGVWVTPDGDAVVTTGAYESEAAFVAASEVGREMGATPDGISDLEVKPREARARAWTPSPWRRTSPSAPSTTTTRTRRTCSARSRSRAPTPSRRPYGR